MLGESKRLHHPHGRAAFGTLLLQDVAVIPGLLAIALLGSSAVSHTVIRFERGARARTATQRRNPRLGSWL